jgi:DNA-binding SARP family transcriptional activator
MSSEPLPLPPPDAGAPIELDLLGTPQLRAPPGPPLRLERKDAALLACIAIEGGMARDLLAEWLWPGAPRQAANGNLRQRLFRLRKLSGHALVQAGPTLLLAGGVHLLPADGELTRQGDLLGCFDYRDCEALDAWVCRQREAGRQQQRERVSAAAARHEAAGELARALELAHWLAHDAPRQEHALRRLMRLHYLRGDPSSAIAAYERFERALKDDTGGRAGAETLELLALVEQACVQPAAAPARRAVLPPSLLRPPRMVGRARELEALGLAWAAGRDFLVIGEAGIGKTRLLHEFAASRPGAAGVCARVGDSAVPFALLARLLRTVHERVPLPPGPLRDEVARVLPELGAAGVAAAEGLLAPLQRAIETMLAGAARQGHREWLLDDLQWADAASLQMLQALLAGETLAGVCWGFAKRPAEAGTPAAALRGALEETGRLASVQLLPLNAAQLQELVGSLGVRELDAAELAPRLLKHTGGNPLFVLDTLKDLLLHPAPRHGVLPQPATLGALIQRRLGQLSPAALGLARVAAIAGTDFSIELAETVLRSTALELADAWAELESAQVFHGAAFAHDLVFEAVQRGVPDAVAQRVHGQAARYLQQQPGADPARLAAHWLAAGQPADAAGAFLQAAQRARTAARRDDEATLLEQAERCASTCGDTRRAFEARCLRVEALRVSAGADAALACAAGLPEAAQDERQRLHAWLALAIVQLQRNDGQAAVQAARQAEAVADALGDEAARFNAATLTANACVMLGHIGQAQAELERARGMAAERGEPLARFRFHSMLGFVLKATGATRAAADALGQALAEARGIGEPSQLHMTLMNASMVRLALGQGPAALGLAHEASRLLGVLDKSDGLEGIDRLNLSMNLMAVGRYGEALEHLLAAPPAALDSWSAHAQTLLAVLWMRLGQPARAKPLVADLHADAPPVMRATRRLVALEYAALQGRVEAQAIDAALGLARTSGDRMTIGRVELMQAQAGGAAAVLQASARLIDETRRVELPVLEMLARTARTEALLATAEHAAAHELALETRQRLGGLDSAWVYMPQLWLRLARCFEALGQAHDARQCMVPARLWIADNVLPTLPPVFRASFLQRNAVNRELLAGTPAAANA